MSKKRNLKQKLAVAMSVVNALNVAAPIALPYVNVTRTMSTRGGHVEPLADVLARSLYGTAQAGSSYDVPHDTSVLSVSVSVMSDGDTMTVNNGGTGIVSTVSSGGVQTALFSSPDP